MFFLFLATLPMTINTNVVFPIQLPRQVEHWSRPDSAQTITAQTIFDYMDGAGELYLGFRFDSLQVVEYTAEGSYNLLVEIYYMQESDDAFGLLSLDLDGERIDWGAAPEASSPSALYGAGLLRLWAGPVYARVMAFQETETARRAVLELGRVIAAQCRSARPPKLIQMVQPLFTNAPLKYFRSHLVLNSIFYLASQNILDLDLSVEGVYAHEGQMKVLLLHYPEARRAAAAAQFFLQSYLPDHQSARCGGFYPLESGYCACFHAGVYLSLLFDCPDIDSGRQWVQTIECRLRTGDRL